MVKIPELHVGLGMTFGPVTVFPVWAAAAPLRGLAMGTDARVEVQELGGDAQVPRLRVTNLGARPALLLEGELLEGGMQTRALAFDVLIAPGAATVVEVACVEQDRWGGSFGHARRTRRVTPSVQQRLRADDNVRQGGVWESVARFEQVTGPTATRSLADHLDRTATTRTLAPLPGQSGVIVGVAGWPVALELFGSRAALAAHLPGILDAAALDAQLAANAAPVPGRRARRFAAALSGLRLDGAPSPVGDGSAVSGRAGEVAARGVAAASGGLAHVSALNLRHELIGAAS